MMKMSHSGKYWRSMNGDGDVQGLQIEGMRTTRGVG
jgi:hypothetical protein